MSGPETPMIDLGSETAVSPAGRESARLCRDAASATVFVIQPPKV
jgi:hypothetical protein